jgi:hypothetical protein
LAISAADFKTLFPEFASVPDVTVETWLDFAECSVCLDRFPDCMQDKAHGFLAAHYLSLALKRSSDSSSAIGGEVSTMSVGDVSISLNSSAITNATASSSGTAFAAELSGTQYGRIFYGMFRRYTYACYSVGLANG